MKKIKEIPRFNRPREKLVAQGVEALSDIELLAALLGSGVKKNSVLQMAHAILRLFDKEGQRPSIKSLVSVEGVGLARACQLVAAFEFSRRRLFRNSVVIQKARDVLPFIAHIAGKKQENFLCVSLNGANEVIGSRVITIGLLDSSQVHPREVFADAIAERAASIILAHNHPSGALKASPNDIAVNKQLLEAGKILGISVLDHIILTRNGWLSFKEEGLM